jgi:hypothetical protein
MMFLQHYRLTRVASDKGGHNHISQITERPPAPAPLRMEDTPQADPVRDTIDKAEKALNDRLVGSPDRTRLRRALDTADAPAHEAKTDRTGQDKAVGRIFSKG